MKRNRLKRKNLLLFDFNNLLHKALAIHPDLSFGGKRTGGLYGFIQQFVKNVGLFFPDNIVVCSDGHPYFRKDIYPDYKGDRKKVHDIEFFEIIKESRKHCELFLGTLDIQFWKVPGFEADDLFAFLCQEYQKQFASIVIVSSDDDLFQLLKWDNVKLQRNKVLYTRANFDSEYNDLSPDLDWVYIKAMAGTHNGVPGLPRVGMITALKIFRDKERFEKIYKEHSSLLDVYKRCIELPFSTNTVPAIPKLESTRYVERKLIKFLSKFGIELQSWMRNSLEKLNN
jgi:DNA polymerase-1